ncbi:protein translocase SEC61 complex subunit gamma [Methanolobus halotolerans]|uniref:Protein translocase subunit SecE n=2 Tax=Methanolobus halotolerans TaxID=2052935 RepID=A0A4E0Q265_9EURY|nr:protein translocase SEC61 complex subunit gamma [Methanolobus halotolerans]TGC06757.1 protein translocase SEC61 complex subunit gamma [Methanolobus halotolerans]
MYLAEDAFDLNKLNRNMGQTLKTYFRVLKLTKKPSREEFQMIAKVAGIGILAIGFVGFLIYLLLVEIPQLV